MTTIHDALSQQGLSGVSKNGQVYVRLPETGASLKVKRINPESYSRANEDDQFSVAKEGLSGNAWAEYFPTAEAMAAFVREKYDASADRT